MNIDDCAAVDCGRGSCIDGVSNYSCNCTGTGFDGTSCEIDINECDQSPCVHNGTCTNFGGGYLCNCVKGYSGKNCETNIDDCASRPCKNGGKWNCKVILPSYKDFLFLSYSDYPYLGIRLFVIDITKNTTEFLRFPVKFRS